MDLKSGMVTTSVDMRMEGGGAWREERREERREVVVVERGGITADLVEWLVADPEVAAAWRGLAAALGLRDIVPSLEVNCLKKPCKTTFVLSLYINTFLSPF